MAFVGDSRGLSKREVVENALMEAYPTEYRRLQREHEQRSQSERGS